MVPAKYPFVAVVGPTAIGKTSFSIALGEHWQTEIISADSRQFFKEMCIGTAVPTKEELLQVPHHFIQHLSIHDEYSAAQFAQEARSRAERLLKDKGRVLVVGGSGLYTDALLKGLNDFPDIPEYLRKKLRERIDSEGLSSLQRELAQLDPSYAAQVDLKNPVRVLRALEVCLASGRPFSSFLQGGPSNLPKAFYIGLTAPRTIIYERIEQRVDLMMRQGLLDEARSLYTHRHLNALNTVGYKELFAHLDGELNLHEAVEEIKKNTRRFAKRQLTWYRKNTSIHWLPYHWTNAKKVAMADLWVAGRKQAPLLLVMGVSGSGKSTLAAALAEALSVPYLDADDFHPEANLEKMKAGNALTDKDRQPWLDVLAQELVNRQDSGAVLACSALKEKYRKTLAEYTPLRTIYLKGDYEYIFQRMKKRAGHFMPLELLQSQFNTLEEPAEAIEVRAEWALDQALQHIETTLEK